MYWNKYIPLTYPTTKSYDQSSEMYHIFIVYVSSFLICVKSLHARGHWKKEEVKKIFFISITYRIICTQIRTESVLFQFIDCFLSAAMRVSVQGPH